MNFAKNYFNIGNQCSVKVSRVSMNYQRRKHVHAGLSRTRKLISFPAQQLLYLHPPMCPMSNASAVLVHVRVISNLIVKPPFVSARNAHVNVPRIITTNCNLQATSMFKFVPLSQIDHSYFRVVGRACSGGYSRSYVRG